jgi:hypothetical protein
VSAPITTVGGLCAVGPYASFTEVGLTTGAPIDYRKLIELDAYGGLYDFDDGLTETNHLAKKSATGCSR